MNNAHAQNSNARACKPIIDEIKHKKEKKSIQKEQDIN